MPSFPASKYREGGYDRRLPTNRVKLPIRGYGRGPGGRFFGEGKRNIRQPSTRSIIKMAASKIISQLIWIPVKIRKTCKTEKIALLRFYCVVENKAPFTIATPTKFENAALFLRLGLPFTLIRHKNGAFRKRSLNRRNQLKTPAFRFLIGENQFGKKSFSKMMASKTFDAF